MPEPLLAAAIRWATAGPLLVASLAAMDAAAKIALLTVMIVLINAVWLIAGASLAPMLRDPRRARVLINAVWLIAGASLAPMLRDPRRARVINVALAAALVGATALA